MSLGNNGYQSEKRGSYFQGVVIMLFLMVMAMLGLTLLVSALLSGCGSGSDTSAPVYNQNGVCVENCGTASDGSVYPPGDTCDHDGCGFQPQKDYVAPPCHVPTDPKIKKWCMPEMYKKSSSCSCLEITPENEKFCAEIGSPPWCSNTGKPCNSDEFCKQVPCEEWPPEVCQGLPCLLVGKWNCYLPSGMSYSSDYSNAKFYDNGDGYCRVDLYNNGGELYYKPGDNHLQWPPSGPPETAYYLTEDGSQLKNATDDPYPCNRITEK